MSAMATPKAGGKSGGKVANRLVALSSAAVLTVYSAGYLRTRAAAEKLEAADRSRVVIPAAPVVSAPPAAVPQHTTPAAPVTNTPVATQPKTPKPAATKVKATPVATANPTPTETPAPAAAAPVTTPTPAIAEPQATPTPTPQPQYKDGTYSGWGTSRHGDIEATVVIASGRITSALISQCWTRYSCSWVAHLQGQVVTRQSPEVDYVSGATQSTNAFYYAVVQALSKAK